MTPTPKGSHLIQASRLSKIWGPPLPLPNNGLTDSNGQSIQYYRPNELGLMTFTVNAGGESETVVVNAVADTGGSIILGLRQTQRQNGSAHYLVEARFLTSTGETVDGGTARFTTSFGSFIDPAGGSTVETTIDHRGKSAALFQITGNGTATITAEYIEGGVVHSVTQAVTVDAPPSLTSDMLLTGPGASSIPVLAVAGNRLVGLVDEPSSARAVIVWDATTLGQIAYWDEGNYPSDQDDFFRGETMGISADGTRAVFSSGTGYGGINLDTGALLFADNTPAYDPDDGVSVAPDGSSWTVVNDTGSGARVDQYNMSGGLIRNIATFSDAQALETSFSPDGSRFAFTVQDDSPSTSEGTLYIYNTSNWSLVTSPIVVDFGSRLNGIAWSPDSQTVAIHNGERQVMMFTRNGATHTPLPQFSIERDAGTMRWSPDGQYIAIHMEDLGVAIHAAQTGVEVIRLDGTIGDDQQSDTVSWRADSQVLFVSQRNNPNIRIFAPFDTTEPVLRTCTRSHFTPASACEP